MHVTVDKSSSIDISDLQTVGIDIQSTAIENASTDEGIATTANGERPQPSQKTLTSGNVAKIGGIWMQTLGGKTAYCCHPERTMKNGLTFTYQYTSIIEETNGLMVIFPEINGEFGVDSLKLRLET